MQENQRSEDNTKLIIYRLDEYNENLKEHLQAEKESWTQFDTRLGRVEKTQNEFLSAVRFIKWTVSVIGAFVVFKWTEAIENIKKLIAFIR